MMIDEVDMETYKERIGRYRIVYHEELPEAHKAEYRLNGIDPDARRVLYWSSNDFNAADEMLTECIVNNASRFKTYYLVDAGKEEIVERAAWL